VLDENGLIAVLVNKEGLSFSVGTSVFINGLRLVRSDSSVDFLIHNPVVLFGGDSNKKDTHCRELV